MKNKNPPLSKVIKTPTNFILKFTVIIMNINMTPSKASGKFTLWTMKIESDELNL